MSRHGPPTVHIGSEGAVYGGEIEAMRHDIEAAVNSLTDAAWNKIYRALVSYHSDMSIAKSLKLTEYEKRAEALFKKLTGVLDDVEFFLKHGEDRHMTLEPLANAIISSMADLKQRHGEWLPYTVNGQREYRKTPMPNQVIGESDVKTRAAKRLYEIARQHDLDAKKLVFAARIHPEQSEEAWAKWYKRAVKGT